MSIRLFSAFAALAVAASGAPVRTPTQDGIVYGEAGPEKLTMDYYAPSAAGPHPIAIIIHGGGYVAGTSKNGSEAYCADFLAPAGYAVFSINYRLAPKYPFPAMLHDVERAIRFVRYHASDWNADARKIALVGGSAGGFLSNMASLVAAPGDKSAADPVDRESARVEAVVTLFGPSDFRGKPISEHLHALLDASIQEKGEVAALADASPITLVTKTAPPFLFIHGDKDESVPFTESVHLQQALQKAGVRADLIRIPDGPHATGSWYKIPGVPDWELEMTAWLNATLHHQGPTGEGIRPRAPQSSTSSQRPPIIGVAHIGLKTKDLAAAREFYGHYLGYQEPFTLDKPSGGLMLIYFKVNDHQYIEVFPELKSETEDRLSHIAFETTNAPQLRDYLAGRGVKVPDALRPGLDGNLSFMTKDPDGHNVEFVQYMPGSLHSRNFGKFLPEARISERIIHVGVTVNDRAEADRFYHDILGFHDIWHGGMTDDRTDWVDMRVPEGTDWLEYMLNAHNPTPKTLGVMHHMALGVPSVEAAYKRLLQRDMKIGQGPKVGRDGKWQLNLYDPDLTRAELMEPKPVQTPCCSPILDK